MSNIIIPPEHQSAPKEPARIIPNSYNVVNSTPAIHGPQDYDREMDLPEYHDPRIQEDLRMLEQQKELTKHERNQKLEKQIEQWEKNYNDPRTQAQRWNGQQRWMGKENEQMRLVRIMHPHTFIYLLNRAGIRASLDAEEPGAIRNCRIWLNSFVRAGRVGVNAWTDGQPVTLTTLQYPYGPEWSIMRFNEYDVPTAEKYRGWRTVLLTLIISNVITEDEAHRAFGKPRETPAASFYLKQLKDHRKVAIGLAKQ